VDKQYVTFKLNNKEYGIDIKNVREITNFTEFTEIPNTLDFIAGLINIRGTVTPIIDLKKRFNLDGDSKLEDKKEKRIIIINIRDKQVGFIIDDASSVITLSENQVDKPPAIISKVIKDFIVGVGKLEDELILILDLERTFDITEKEELLKIEV